MLSKCSALVVRTLVDLHCSSMFWDSFPGSHTAASHWNDEFSVSDNKNLQRSWQKQTVTDWITNQLAQLCLAYYNNRVSWINVRTCQDFFCPLEKLIEFSVLNSGSYNKMQVITMVKASGYFSCFSWLHVYIVNMDSKNNQWSDWLRCVIAAEW